MTTKRMKHYELLGVLCGLLMILIGVVELVYGVRTVLVGLSLCSLLLMGYGYTRRDFAAEVCFS